MTTSTRTSGTTERGDALAQRYGAAPRWRGRALVAAVAVVAVAFGGWLAWTTYEQADPPVSSTQVGFSIVDDGEAKATLNVQFRDQSVTGAACYVEALAADHSVVGRLTFHPQAQPQPQTYIETIRTERRASSVTSLGCNAHGQPQLH